MSAAAVQLPGQKRKSRRAMGVALLAVSAWGAVLLVMAIMDAVGGIEGAAIALWTAAPGVAVQFMGEYANMVQMAAYGAFVAAVVLLLLLLLAWRNGVRDRSVRVLTPAEQEKRETAAARAVTDKAEIARLRQVKRVAIKLRKEIITHLATAGFTYIYERRGINVKASKPEIKHVLYGKDSIWFRLDKLPFRINYTDLMEDEVATNMSIAVGRECEIISNTQLGLFVRVDLRSGYHAIPNVFPWYDKASDFNAMDKLPKSNPYAFALGVGKNRHVHHVDFRNLPHLLVAGATDGGKSVFLNQMILTLLVNNPPSRLQMIMIDLKDGLELYPYRGIPHLIRPIIHEQDKVIEALHFAMKVKAERAELFRESGVRKIQDWNKTHHTTLPYILIVIDEIAAIMMNQELKGEMTETMRLMAEQVRALGIHFVICTQRPDKDALPGAIKSNIPKRVVFAMDEFGSRVVINTQHAAKLTSKTGRMFYKDGTRLRELQAPWISPDEIAATIAKLVANEPASPLQVAGGDDGDDGAAPAVAPVVEVDPIKQAFGLALDNRAGAFSTRDVYADMKHALTKNEVESIAADYEYSFEDSGPIIEVGGERYILAPPLNGRAARRLVLVGAELPTSLAEIYAA